MEDYCLSYECGYSDSSIEWLITIKACLCLDQTIGTKFIADAMDRVEESIRCCGTQPIRDSNCKDEINVIDQDLVANYGRITRYIVRSDGSTSFLTSNAQIRRNNITDTVNIMRSTRNLSDVFHNKNWCLGPAWITKAETEKFHYKPLQLKLFIR